MSKVLHLHALTTHTGSETRLPQEMCTRFFSWCCIAMAASSSSSAFQPTELVGANTATSSGAPQPANTASSSGAPQPSEVDVTLRKKLLDEIAEFAKQLPDTRKDEDRLPKKNPERPAECKLADKIRKAIKGGVLQQSDVDQAAQSSPEKDDYRFTAGSLSYTFTYLIL